MIKALGENGVVLVLDFKANSCVLRVNGFKEVIIPTTPSAPRQD